MYSETNPDPEILKMELSTPYGNPKYYDSTGARIQAMRFVPVRNGTGHRMVPSDHPGTSFTLSPNGVLQFRTDVGFVVRTDVGFVVA